MASMRAAAIGWAGCGSLALGLLSCPARAAERRFELDAPASEVRFRLGATMHEVRGSFRFTAGSLTFDPATGAATGRVRVDAGSGDTGNAKRDRNMHQKVLESALHPEIAFEVQHVRGAVLPPGGAIEIEGVLELQGTGHPLKLAAKLEYEGSRATASGSFSVPYVEWGLEDPSVFVLRVEKSVEVTFRLVGVLGGALAD